MRAIIPGASMVDSSAIPAIAHTKPESNAWRRHLDDGTLIAMSTGALGSSSGPHLHQTAASGDADEICSGHHGRRRSVVHGAHLLHAPLGTCIDAGPAKRMVTVDRLWRGEP